MRGATCVIVQTHQILRLPRKMNLMIDPWHKWNVIYNARSNMRHSPNSPNTAPATKNDRPKSQRNLLKTDETSFPMRGRSDHDPRMIRPWSEHETVRPQPASQPRLPFTPTTSILYWKIQHFALRLSFQISPNNAPATTSVTWTSPNTAPILFTHETLCTMRGVTSVIVLTHQILRLPRKMNRMIEFTMRGATCVIVQTHQILRLPLKMTVQNLKEICWKRMKRHFQCAADPTMIREWSDHDPSMKPSVRNPPRNRGYLSRPPRAFCIEKYNISRSGYHSKFHRILRLPRKVTLELHQVLRLPRKVTLIIDSELWLHWAIDLTELWLHWAIDLTELWLHWAMTWLSYYLTDLLLDWGITWLSYWLDWAMTSLSYDLTELLTSLSYDFTELSLDWAMTSLSYHLTELWLDWTMTWLSYDFTELSLDWSITWLSYDLTELLTWLSYDFTELSLDWAMTSPSYHLTELWLDWSMTWLSYDFTELSLDWSITWLSYDLTELWLDWAIDLTELWLHWAITWLNYDLTELLLDWAMTWLSYDFTELLLDWAMTWLSYDLTELLTWLSYDLTEPLLCNLVRISEVSQLNLRRRGRKRGSRYKERKKSRNHNNTT